MDICMFTPAERVDLKELVAEFQEVKGRIVAFLNPIEKEWDEEWHTAAMEDPNSETIHEAFDRLHTIGRWKDLLDDPLFDLEELEPSTDDE